MGVKGSGALCIYTYIYVYMYESRHDSFMCANEGGEEDLVSISQMGDVTHSYV